MHDSTKSTIVFSSHEIDFKLQDRSKIIQWLLDTAEELNHKIDSLNYYFCDDNTIKEINQSFLNHDYETDIITFPYQYNPVEAEIYISIDTVNNNAKRFDVEFKEELLRVIIHGLLHMLGYDDKTDEMQSEMRAAENRYLKIYYQVNQVK